MSPDDHSSYVYRDTVCTEMWPHTYHMKKASLMSGMVGAKVVWSEMETIYHTSYTCALDGTASYAGVDYDKHHILCHKCYI